MRRKKDLRWGFQLLLAFMLVFTTLAGCAKSDPAPDSSESPAGEDDVVELTMFVDQSFWPLKDWSGPIPEEITKRTGVRLKVQVAVDNQQLPLMISSGTLPDLVFTSSQFEAMSDPKISYTWDELIEKYNIEGFNIDPLARVLNEAKDGKLYSVRNGFTNPELFRKTPTALGNVPAFVYRPDILEELGMKIESLDDLLKVFEQVKQKYPDMVPLVMSPLAIGQYFRVNFGAPYQGWYADGDQAKYYISHPKQYDYYMFMNRLYREGYITAENFTWSDSNKAKEMLINGQAFSANDANAVNTINTEMKAAGKDYSVSQLTKLIGDSPALYASAAGWSGTFITKNCKNPEAAIRFLQFMQSDEGQKLGLWGIEGVHYTLEKPIEEGGYPIFTYDSQDATEQQRLGAVWWGLLADNGLYQMVQRYVPDSETTLAQLDAKQYVISNPLLGAVNPPTGSDEQVIKANIDNMITTEQVKIFLAETEEEAKAAYEKMMQTAKDIGLDRLEAYATQKYKETIERYNAVK